jgi:nicotinamide-nucleotide amidase
MRLEIVTIGKEVLSGRTLNKNATFLGKTLSDLGYEVSLETTIPDNPFVIEETLLKSLKRSKLTLVTGGLGITTDDCTKDVIESRFKEAKPIPNTLGDAPGRLFEEAEHKLVFLPGVPHEMQEMFLTHIVPKLPSWLPHEPYFKTKTLFLLGLKEKEINAPFTAFQKNYPTIEIGIYPSLGFLEIQLKSVEDVLPLIKEIKELYKERVLEDLNVEKALHNLLIEKKLTLSIAESCTGGALSYAFTSQSGASNYFLGSIVAYSNEVKKNLLNVLEKTLETEGAVSEETVSQMCSHIQNLMKSDISIAVSGIAGPLGGTEKKPVGTVYVGIKIGTEIPKITPLSIEGNREIIIKKTINSILCDLFLRVRQTP